MIGKTKQLGVVVTREPLYNTWRMMNYRCYSEKHISYKSYGGKGVTVCEEWRWDNPNGFNNFCEDVGKRPESHTLDRRVTTGNYEPGNVRWATSKEQQNNLRTEKDTESGRLGVVLYNGKWIAQIYLLGATRCIGIYSNKEQAVESRARVENIRNTEGDAAAITLIESTTTLTIKGKRKYFGKTSDYYGVSWDKARRKWRAAIAERVGGKLKQVALGRYEHESEAAQAVKNYLGGINEVSI